jgi:hypothetical protein
MKCAVKQVAGKAIDDAKLEPDGKAGNVDRKVQSYLAILTSCLDDGSVQFCLNPLRDLTRLRDSGRRQCPPVTRRTIKTPAWSGSFSLEENF